jgi:hypothetical protein
MHGSGTKPGLGLASGVICTYIYVYIYISQTLWIDQGGSMVISMERNIEHVSNIKQQQQQQQEHQQQQQQ